MFAALTGSAGSWDDDSVVVIRDLRSAGLNRRTYWQGMVGATEIRSIERVGGHLSSQDLARVLERLRQIIPL